MKLPEDHELTRREILKAGTFTALTPFLERIPYDSKPVEEQSAKDALVTGLTCEYMTNPLGIHEPQPRLSWQIRTAERGWEQDRYRILVASDPKFLAFDRGDIWDSGQVRSKESVLIPYAGPSLRAAQRYWWKVRSWNEFNRATPWSELGFWAMGLLEEVDWASSYWIGHDVILENTQKIMPPAERVPAPAAKAAPFMRREFGVRGKVHSAMLYASGLGFAQLHLNGKEVSTDRERDPGYTNFNKRVLYVTHDVTDLLNQGPNVMGAILGTGWYDVHDVATWHFDTAPWRARPRLRSLLIVHYDEGNIELVGSDSRWKTSSGPILRDGIYTGEIYDARQEMPGWSEPGFDDSEWKSALVVPAPFGKLVPIVCPPVKISQTLVPVAVSEPKPGVFIVDMGQNMSGHAQLRVSAPSGTTVVMRYAELLGPDGMINTAPIDHLMEKTEPLQPFQQDTYICKGGSEEIWEQRFSYSGFQYVEVTGYPGKFTADNIRGRFAHTSVESAGEFVCSNEIINRLQHATRWSYLSNAQSIPTDCPQREKNGWTADAQLAVDTGMINYQAASFYTKWLDDFADAQRAEGGIPVLVPNGGWGNGEGWPGEIVPPWDSAYGIIAWALYQYCGDRRILERHYQGWRKYVELFAEQQTHGVCSALGSIGDWAAWRTKTPISFISTAYLYLDAVLLASMARKLGKVGDADKYERLAILVKQGCNATFLDAKSGNYANGSQTANAIALCFGIVPEDNKLAVAAALVKNVRAQGHVDTGIIGAKYLLRALTNNGHAELAYHLVVQPKMPGWSYWISEGATTLWETWNGNASHNHIMFGDISAWFFNSLAGIVLDVDSDGIRRILIRPMPVGDLRWVRARYISMYGKIDVRWVRSDDSFELHLEIPPNITVNVIFPEGFREDITENGTAISQAKSVKVDPFGKKGTYVVGSGSYAFRSNKEYLI